MDNNVNKPITIIREEFINTITNMVNDSCLPPFILEPIFKDIHAQIKLAEQKQLESDIRNYNEAISKQSEVTK